MDGPLKAESSGSIPDGATNPSKSHLRQAYFARVAALPSAQDRTSQNVVSLVAQNFWTRVLTGFACILPDRQRLRRDGSLKELAILVPSRAFGPAHTTANLPSACES